jgi:WXG100 family type VII secretion target
MTIAYDPSRHAELLAALGRAADGIQAEFDGLDEVAAGLRAQWSGEAQRAYDRAHGEWTASMAVLQRALREAARAADRAGARLAEADETVASLWR